MAGLLTPLRIVADLALPPRCPGCGAVVGDDHRFCAPCWQSLHFLGPPWCAACNLPFPYDRGEGAMCGTCLAQPPHHAGVRAAVAYGPVASAVALRLKYGGRTALAETAARQMARWVPADATLIVPVPLHRWRLWSRGYNQAARIGEVVAWRTGVPIALDAIERHRATPALRGQGRRQRGKTVAGAFRLSSGGADRVRGASVVLVDDVYTTGATTDACLGVLLRAGAARVTILCWARVIDEEDA